METILTQYYQSPYGELLLGSFGDKLCLCDWMLNEKRRVTVDKRIRQALHADYEEGTSEVIARAIIQLDEYFACKRTIFDVPLLAVGTEFQRTVWQELQNIPYGKTVSYASFHESWAIRKPYARWRLPMGQMPSPYSSPAIVWWAAIIR